MGFEFVELIMKVEDDFEIAISDEEVENCLTVKELVDVIYSHVKHGNSDPCLSQHRFYIIRKILMEELALERSQIRPDTKLENVITKSKRKEVLRKIEDLDYESPGACWLVRPKWLNHLIFWVIPGLACVIYMLCGWPPKILTLPVGIIVAILGFRITAPFKNEFPSHLRQVKDLISYVPVPKNKAWTKTDVFERVREITAAIFCIEVSLITLKTDYEQDLDV